MPTEYEEGKSGNISNWEKEEKKKKNACAEITLRKGGLDSVTITYICIYIVSSENEGMDFSECENVPQRHKYPGMPTNWNLFWTWEMLLGFKNT